MSQSARAKMRKDFERVAKEEGKDPLLARSWYDIPYSLVLQKCQNVPSGKIRGGYLGILKFLFLEINFDGNFFRRYSWIQMVHRRQFFENFAVEHGFNVKDTEQWYTQPKDNFLSTKGASSVLFYHKHSVAQALVDLFPDIGLEKSKFRTVWNEAKNRRLFFENYAKHNKFDPFISSNWMLHKHKISSLPEISKILYYHEYNLAKALSYLFPEVAFDNFPSSSRWHWRDPSNRKQFFENYAKKKGFDYSCARHWYSHPIHFIAAEKGAEKVLAYHKGSVTEALVELFPEISFDKNLFVSRSLPETPKHSEPSLRDKYEDPEKRKEFFIQFANQKGFDAYDPSRWYEQDRRDILSLTDVAKVLRHHRHSVPRALTDLFPTLPFDKSKLNLNYVWSVKENRKKFFERIAKRDNLDPLLAESWYNVPRENIFSEKGARGVLAYYNQSIPSALLDVFPDIGLNKNCFKMQGDTETKRKFFLKIATENGFDALKAENWYSCSKQAVMATQGYTKALVNGNFLISKALLDSFPDIGLDPKKLHL